MGTFEKSVTPTRLAIGLRLYLTASGIDQKTIAKQLGCSESTISRFLTGTATPEPLTLLKLFQWLMEEV